MSPKQILTRILRTESPIAMTSFTMAADLLGAALQCNLSSLMYPADVSDACQRNSTPQTCHRASFLTDHNASVQLETPQYAFFFFFVNTLNCSDLFRRSLMS